MRRDKANVTSTRPWRGIVFVQHVSRRILWLQRFNPAAEGVSAGMGTQAKAHLVVSLGADGKCSLDQHNLKEVIAPVRDQRVVVVSVAGAFRKGKSFLLNMFLKYLQDPENWMAPNDSGLHGFPWRSGTERETTGIHLWSQPIMCEMDDGTQVAVLLMDTQGIFDNVTTKLGNSKIFLLSTLLSSIQIYNLSEQIQSTDMADLEYFAKCARHSSHGSIKFQNLVFLVRNYELGGYEYGADGGMEYLESIWQNYDQENELNNMKQNIKSCFESTECFLMPHPGRSVSGKSEDNFKMSDLDLCGDFKSYLQEFVEGILSRENLIQKDVGGVMTAGEWAELFSKIVTTINANSEMLSSPPLFEVVAATVINAVKKTALENFMIVVREEIKTVESMERYVKIYDDARRNAVTYFENEVSEFEEKLLWPKREEMLQVIEETHERNLIHIQVVCALKEQQRITAEAIRKLEAQNEKTEKMDRDLQELREKEARLSQELEEQREKQNKFLVGICTVCGLFCAAAATVAAIVAAPVVAAAGAGSTVAAAITEGATVVGGSIAAAVGETGFAVGASNMLMAAGTALVGIGRMLR